MQTMPSLSKQLSVDPRRSPQRVGDAHLADKLAYLCRYVWSATTTDAPVSRASKAGHILAAQLSAGYTINISGFDLRQAQRASSPFGSRRGSSKWRLQDMTHLRNNFGR
jgi:hypothetical protein